MTSRCSEDCKGRVKINCCVTATPFPLGLSTVPLGSSAGLGSGWGAHSLGADDFFCLFVCFSSWLGPLSAPARGFFGPFVVFFPPPHPFAVMLFPDKVLGYAFWSSAILYIEAFQGGVGESSRRGEMLAGWKGGALPCAAVSWGPCRELVPPKGNGRGEEGALVELSCSYDEECEVQR